tara:strand:+ start:5294 stop:6511 length:1218 start_codon:yes stop_codon:yes gene_type:complete
MKKNIAVNSILLYTLFFFTSIIALQEIWFGELFNSTDFLNWDAGHYHFIKNFGYEGHRVAFFPLFPLIWRFLSVGEYGIIIFNTTIYFVSFYFLIKELKIKSIQQITFYLCIPSFIFFYLPFSESLFFLTSVVLLIGLKKHKDYLVYLGLFFAILSRPAFTIFIPALIITEILSKRRDKIYFRICIYTLITILGILIVGYIQYIDTGEWFQFFKAQKNWGNELQFPKFPLTSWGSGYALGLDGFACLVGVISGSIILSLLIKLKWLDHQIIPKEVIFSFSYLGGITLLVLLYRGGSLFSLNRFVFATPFIIVVLNYWISQNIHLKIKKLLLIFFLIFIFWLLFGSYTDLFQLLKFTLLSLYAILIFSIKSDREYVRKYSIIILIILNFTFQVVSFVGILNHKWIG